MRYETESREAGESCGRKKRTPFEAAINSRGLALACPQPPSLRTTLLPSPKSNQLAQTRLSTSPLHTHHRVHPDPSYSYHILNMGWLPWSSGESKTSPKTSDGGRIAPDRTSRARCWEGRDKFFACLDRNNILDAIKDDNEARRKCAKEVEEFEAACSQTWVCS